MTDDTLMQYILDYVPIDNSEFQMVSIDGYDFTFYVDDGKAIGAVLDMNREPQIHILEEHRGYGLGSHLLKMYIMCNDLTGSCQYVFYHAVTDDGVRLIASFKERYGNMFKVFSVGLYKHIILRDNRF